MHTCLCMFIGCACSFQEHPRRGAMTATTQHAPGHHQRPHVRRRRRRQIPAATAITTTAAITLLFCLFLLCFGSSVTGSRIHEDVFLVNRQQHLSRTPSATATARATTTHAAVNLSPSSSNKNAPPAADGEKEQPESLPRLPERFWSGWGWKRQRGRMDEPSSNQQQQHVDSSAEWKFPGKEIVEDVLASLQRRPKLEGSQCHTATTNRHTRRRYRPQRSAVDNEDPQKPRASETAAAKAQHGWSFPGKGVLASLWWHRKTSNNDTQSKLQATTTFIPAGVVFPDAVFQPAVAVGDCVSSSRREWIHTVSGGSSDTAIPNSSETSSFTVVSVINSTHTECLLLSVPSSSSLSTQPTTSKTLSIRRSVAGVHSLALLSDTIVLYVDGLFDDDSNNNMIEALEAGALQRARSGLSKARLVVVVAATDAATMTESSLREIRERLVTHELRRMTPDMLECLDIVADAPPECVVTMPRDTTSIVGGSLAVFPVLLQETYRLLGGEGDLILENEESDRDTDSAQQTLVVDGDGSGDAEDNSKSSTISTSTWKVHTSATKDALSTPNIGHAGPEPQAFLDSASLLHVVHKSLDELQVRQEDNLMDPGSMPMDFCSLANPVLDALALTHNDLPTDVIEIVATRLRVLYQQHVEILRDHYGKMYEAMLDHASTDEASWNAMQSKVTESFREDAQNAMPRLARRNELFSNDMGLDYIVSLQGLSSDLKVSAEMRQSLSVEDEYEPITETPASVRKRKILKSCKRLAARGLMLAVNYLQGYLAWQGIKRTALNRERTMPKFPIF